MKVLSLLTILLFSPGVFCDENDTTEDISIDIQSGPNSKGPEVNHLQNRILKLNGKDRFKLLAELGRGAFAITYKALDLNTTREVALRIEKKLTVEILVKGTVITSKEDKSLKFQNDYFKAIAEQNSKHLLLYSSVQMGQIDNLNIVFRTMELLQDLFDTNAYVWLSFQNASADEVEADIQRVETLAFQMIDMLNELAKIGFVHKDIKPANMGMDSEGILRLFDPDLVTPINLAPQYFLSTIMITPPEHFNLDKKNVSAFIDLYAVGASLFMLISKEFPVSHLLKAKPKNMTPYGYLFSMMNDDQRYRKAVIEYVEDFFATKREELKQFKDFDKRLEWLQKFIVYALDPDISKRLKVTELDHMPLSYVNFLRKHYEYLRDSESVCHQFAKRKNQ